MGLGLMISGQLSVCRRASRNQWRHLLRGNLNQQLANLYFSLDYNINYLFSKLALEVAQVTI